MDDETAVFESVLLHCCVSLLTFREYAERRLCQIVLGVFERYHVNVKGGLASGAGRVIGRDMARKVPPRSIDLVAYHPKALAMNSAAYGILARLLDHFWLTDCAPLPTVDHALYVLSRAHKPTWFQNRDDVKAVLQDVLPELRAARELHDKRHNLLSDLRSRGHHARRQRKLEKSIEPPSSIGKNYRPRTAERNRDQDGASAKQGGFVDKL